ncbi:hypothetical protein ABPG75_002430 [Micractinium tetrahymenae]
MLAPFCQPDGRCRWHAGLGLGSMSLALAAAVLLAAFGSASALLRDYEKDFNWDLSYGNLNPVSDRKYNHDYWYQVPDNPRGAVLFAHGCVHSGYNYWPQSEACPECRGLPEEMSHTLQALRRGYAVIAISSMDRKTGCYSFWDDCFNVADIVQEWRDDWGLDHLPLYGFGVSAGGAFILKLPRYMKLDGVVSEALGIDPASGGFRDVPGQYPPAMFFSMQRDDKQRELIDLNQEILRTEKNAPAEVIKVYPRKVYPTYFSDRDPWYINEKLSQKIWTGLFNISMIDEDGNVLEDPRYTPRPWLKQLQAKVPELRGGKTEDGEEGTPVPVWPETSPDVLLPGVWSLMNLAYAAHEIISDYVTVALLWFESGEKENVKDLMEWYTYGLPPPPSPPPPSPSPPLRPPPPRPPAPKPPVVLAPAPQPTATEADVSLSTDGSVAPGPQSTSSSGGNTSSGGSTGSGGGGMSSSTIAIIAGATGGGVAVFLIALVTWCCLRRRRAAREAAAGGAGGPPATMQAVHMAPSGLAGVQAHVSIVPGVKERFDLTEVVEQTGSPYSARRRNRTVFQSDSPHKTDAI